MGGSLRGNIWAFGGLLGLFGCGSPTPPAPAETGVQRELPGCEGLLELPLTEATITAAEVVRAGGFEMPASDEGPGGPKGSGAPPGGQASKGPPGAGGPSKGGMRGPFGSTSPSEAPRFCRVALTLTPSVDSEIRTEVWLPMDTWNGKFFGVGNWGWGGSIRYDGLLLGVKDGYAVASNDTGHGASDGPMGSFALDHPEKVVDYGYRANHAMTLQAKAIVEAFYGKKPERSYWVGCSLGGQQALTEALRFPDDYDGIVAGAPANPIVRLNAWQIWPSVLIHQDPRRAIPDEKMAFVEEQILAQCDPLDGVRDGVLEDPEACPFDVTTLRCDGDDAATCLTAPQVELLQILSEGFVDPSTGEVLHAPFVLGSPGHFAGGEPMGVATALFRYMVFQDPDWDWTTLDPVRDIRFGEAVLRTVNAGTGSDLGPFFARGGKLLMYHGWNDGNSPAESFAFHDAVVRTVGPEATDSMRVFAVPGMGHCMGGDGCDTFDKLAAIDAWVTSGQAPERIEASKLEDGSVVRTHPLCAHPRVAVYDGEGDIDEAASFRCETPEQP